MKKKPELEDSIKRTNKILDDAINKPKNQYIASKALLEASKETTVSMVFASRILSGLKAVSLATVLPVMAILGPFEMTQVATKILCNNAKEFATGKTLTLEAKEERDRNMEIIYFDKKNLREEKESKRDISNRTLAENALIAKTSYDISTHIIDSIDI